MENGHRPNGQGFPLSVLDLAPIVEGSTATQAIRNSLELAKLAEELGYRRYWFAEHHGMASIASSAPELLISRTAAVTERIRVGSGGIMLQNHAPLKAAEAFHTLEAMFPGRIDLGIGRAPGTDPRTSQALRPFEPQRFGEHLTELIGLSRGTLPGDHPFHGVRVIPSDVTLPPIWMLGSSGGSARLAGELGLGYSFARHFSPAPPKPAIDLYRDSFRSSEQFARPHVILAVAVVCAETDERADYLASSMDLGWTRINRGEFRPIPSPDEADAYDFTPQERLVVERYRRLVFVGDPATVRTAVEEVIAETGADEVIVTSTIFSHEERMRSYALLAEEFGLGSSG
ncbi:MAG: MsnO8 family LLM class oxidoreductase [Gemmatimonas sp.]|nr:MsnO8 family LLM class oxidoreductase [Gemmatimonas sp.]